MPRRPPARVRADLLRARPLDGANSTLPYLSPQGTRAIAYLERSRFWNGAVNQALRAWSRFVQDPWHRLWDPGCGCGVMECCPNPPELRAILEAAAHVLPRDDARRFRTQVADLDAAW